MCLVGTVDIDPPCRRVRYPDFKIETPEDNDFPSSGSYEEKQQKRNNIEKKEKSRDAARERRAKESDYFQELEQLVPVANPVPTTSTATNVDKTSLIRLALAYLKTRQFISNSLPESQVKEEDQALDLDVQSCLGGFSLVLSDQGDIIFVSNNVQKYIGLSMTELTGNILADYVHPCDHRQLEKLTPNMEGETEDQWKEVFLRIKCTVTERGRIVNLKQASYKVVKITGRAHAMPTPVNGGGLQGTIFMGVVSVIGHDSGVPYQLGMFSTKHSQDMKLMEMDSWLNFVAGYKSQQLMGQSYFDLVHSGDIGKVQKSFKNLKEQGQCETPAYRLLVRGGGWVWIKTAATLTTTRRSSNKGQIVTCHHSQITEVEERDKVLALIQIESSPKPGGKQKGIAKETSSENKAKAFTCEEQGLDILSCESLKLMEDILGEGTVKTATSLPRSVIIEPRNAEREANKNSQSGSLSPTCCPTSVIVNSTMNEGPKPVTESFFQKTRPDVVPKPVTALLFQKSEKEEDSKAITESLFQKNKANEQSKSLSESTVPKPVTSDIFKSHITENSTNKKTEELRKKKEENDIFASLFDFDNMEELEKLAPYIGNDSMIPLTNLEFGEGKEGSVFELPQFTEDNDKDKLMTFDEPIIFDGKERKQKMAFINPNNDLMWGSPSNIFSPCKEQKPGPSCYRPKAPDPRNQYTIKEFMYNPHGDVKTDGGGIKRVYQGMRTEPDQVVHFIPQSPPELKPIERPKQVYYQNQEIFMCPI